MKKRIPIFILSSLLLLASCMKTNNTNEGVGDNSITTTKTSTTTSNNTSTSNNNTSNDTTTSTSIGTTTSISVTNPVDPEDNEQDITSSFTITTEDGSYSQNGTTYTIDSAGTYILSGNLEDGNIIVDAEGAAVELALENTSSTSTNFAPNFWACCFMLYVKSKPFIPSTNPGKFSTLLVVVSWPPGWLPLITTGLKFARAR